MCQNVPVQFEGVGTVSVGGFLLQVAGQVDDWQCSKRTFLQSRNNNIAHVKGNPWWTCKCECSQLNVYLDTDSTADTQRLRDPNDLTLWRHLDTQLTCEHKDSWWCVISDRRLCGWSEQSSHKNRLIRGLWCCFFKNINFFNLFCFSSSCCCVRHSPMRVTGQLFLHSWRHFLGLHLSWLTMAILVFFSAMVVGRATGSSTWGAERPGYRDQC